MKFIIQTIDNLIIHDFSFTLERAKEYYDWSKTEKLEITYFDGIIKPESDIPEGLIPVGSVEFVSDYLRRFFPDHTDALRPLNVPECLFPYAGRKILNMRSTDDLKDIFFLFRTRAFRKSMDTIKHPGNGITDKNQFKECTGFQLSDIIDIQSEWRVLVFHNNIMHIANYAGDCTMFPDVNRIKEMIKTFSPTAPAAYTLDVGLKSGKTTVVIECHRFFSCGLYGYNDYAKYPKMLSQAWYEMIHPKRR